jgi:anaphase-promoting complex subunit 4
LPIVAMANAEQPVKDSAPAAERLWVTDTKGRIQAIAQSPDGKLLAAGEVGADVHLFNAQNGEPSGSLKVLDEQEEGVMAKFFRRKPKNADEESARPVMSAWALAFAPDSRRLAIWYSFGTGESIRRRGRQSPLLAG